MQRRLPCISAGLNNVQGVHVWLIGTRWISLDRSNMIKPTFMIQDVRIRFGARKCRA